MHLPLAAQVLPLLLAPLPLGLVVARKKGGRGGCGVRCVGGSGGGERCFVLCVSQLHITFIHSYPYPITYNNVTNALFPYSTYLVLQSEKSR